MWLTTCIYVCVYVCHTQVVAIERKSEGGLFAALDRHLKTAQVRFRVSVYLGLYAHAYSLPHSLCTRMYRGSGNSVRPLLKRMLACAHMTCALPVTCTHIRRTCSTSTPRHVTTLTLTHYWTCCTTCCLHSLREICTTSRYAHTDIHTHCFPHTHTHIHTHAQTYARARAHTGAPRLAADMHVRI